MSKSVLRQLQVTPDTGSITSPPGEYDFAQNIRGWGGLMSKRQGIRTSYQFSSGVMGIHDMKVDGDPNSLDKILVTLYNGDIYLFDYNELFPVFAYELASGVYFNFQSPDLNWWQLSIDASGIVTITSIAAPVTTRSTDLALLQSQNVGYADSTGVWGVSVDTSGVFTVTRYVLSEPETTISASISFTSGVGLVTTDGNLNRWRTQIANGGFLTTTAI